MSAVVTATLGNLEMKAASDAVPVSGVSDPLPFMFDWFGGFSAVAGPAVTPASAMQVPTVAACVSLISGAISTLPVKIYKDATDGGRTEAPDHPAFALVHDDANEWTAAGQLRGQLVADAMLRGAGYGLVRRDEKGEPFEILRLDPSAVSIEQHPFTGEPLFRVSTSPGHEIISYADMIYVPAPISLDGIKGTSIIHRARDAISLALALERHAARIMSRGARPSGIINAPTLKTREAAANLGASFVAQTSNENGGGLATVYGGHTFLPVEFKTVDLQFMEMRAFQVHEIAKAFNVPPTLVGELAKATLSNSETMGRQFLQMTLLPWINTLRAAYRRTLISRDDRKVYSIDFVTDGLLQADSVQRAAFYAAMRSNGIMTPNECRRLENFPDHTDGDRLESPHTTTSTAPALEAPVV